MGCFWAQGSPLPSLPPLPLGWPWPFPLVEMGERFPAKMDTDCPSPHPVSSTALFCLVLLQGFLPLLSVIFLRFLLFPVCSKLFQNPVSSSSCSPNHRILKISQPVSPSPLCSHRAGCHFPVRTPCSDLCAETASPPACSLLLSPGSVTTVLQTKSFIIHYCLSLSSRAGVCKLFL